MFADVEKLLPSQALMIAVTGILVVMAELALLSVLILLISKIIRFIASKGKSKAKPAPEAAAEPITEGAALPDTQSSGSLTLIDTDEPTAAVIMAIVSDSSGIPLNHLLFKSIKRVGTDS